MKKIRAAKEKPSWFNIKDYDSLREFTPAELSNEISRRIGLRYYQERKAKAEKAFRYYEDNEARIDAEFLYAMKNKVMVDIRPLLDFHDFEDDEFLNDVLREGRIIPLLEKGYSSNLMDESSFRPICADDVTCMSLMLHELKEVGGIDLLDDESRYSLCNYLSTSAPFTVSAFQYLKRLHGNEDFLWDHLDISRYYFNVDVDAPKEVILKDVENWYDEHRKKTIDLRPPVIDRKKGSLTKYKQKVVSHKLIPYMDLLIWGKQNNVLITHHAYGDILFPDESDVDTTEKFRKLTLKTASVVFNKSYYDNKLDKTV